LSCFVLDYVPVLNQKSVIYEKDVSGDPIRRQPDAGKAAVKNNIVPFSDD